MSHSTAKGVFTQADFGFAEERFPREVSIRLVKHLVIPLNLAPWGQEAESNFRI